MLPLYSIELNRNNQNEFVLAGMDPHIRIYDRRNIEALTSKPVKSFCPDLIVNFKEKQSRFTYYENHRIVYSFFFKKKIENMRHQPSVTCAIYNHDGTGLFSVD